MTLLGNTFVDLKKSLAGLHWALVLRGECGAVPPWWSAYHLLGPRFFPSTLEERRRRRDGGKKKGRKTERKDTGHTEASTERKPWHGGGIEYIE